MENLFEKQALIALLQYKDIEIKSIKGILEKIENYSWLVGQIEMNRVAGIIYFAINENGLFPYFKPDFVKILNRSFIYNKMRCRSYKKFLAQLSEKFENADFKYALLKGSYLAGDMYPEGLRISNDFDILVNQDDISKIENIFRGMGFVQGYYSPALGVMPASRKQILYSRMNNGETVPFVKTTDDVFLDVINIDINFSLDYKAKGGLNLVPELLSASFPYYIDRKKLFTLAPHEFFIHLCMHLFKEATVYNWVSNDNDSTLYKYCDIYTFVTALKGTDFLSGLTKKIRLYGLEKECYYVMLKTAYLFSSLYQIDGYRETIESLKPADTSYLNTIIYPRKNKTYTYDMDFVDWVFSVNKTRYLTEIT